MVLELFSMIKDTLKRLCSGKNDPGRVYNGMLPWETTGNDGVKIPSSAWNEPSGFLVPSDHVILGFDADQKDNSKGFEISYLIEGKIPTEIEKSG